MDECGQTHTSKPHIKHFHTLNNQTSVPSPQNSVCDRGGCAASAHERVTTKPPCFLDESTIKYYYINEGKLPGCLFCLAGLNRRKWFRKPNTPELLCCKWLMVSSTTISQQLSSLVAITFLRFESWWMIWSNDREEKVAATDESEKFKHELKLNAHFLSSNAERKKLNRVAGM